MVCTKSSGQVNSFEFMESRFRRKKTPPDHGICPAWLYEDLHQHHSGSEGYVLCRILSTQAAGR